MKYNTERQMTYRKWWDKLREVYGSLCFYCKKEIATTIDHVVPYSWDHDNAIENLVPSCTVCNCLGHNRMFDNVWEKRSYILARREKRENRRAICRDCLLPFAYRSHSPSPFLCAFCYDKEYLTKWADKSEWSKWLGQLNAAGIMVNAHIETLRRIGPHTRREDRNFIAVLIDEYAKAFDSDPIFFRLLSTG